MIRGRKSPIVAAVTSLRDAKDPIALETARAKTTANGKAQSNRPRGSRSVCAGSTNTHPDSTANKTSAGPKETQIRNQARRSKARPLDVRISRNGHQPAAVTAAPQSALTRIAKANSRFISCHPMGRDRPTQLVEQLWVQRFHRFYQSRHRGSKIGTQKLAQRDAGTGQLDCASGHSRPKDECSTSALTPYQPFQTKSIKNLGNRRIGKAVSLSNPQLNVASRSCVQFAQSEQHGVFEVATGKPQGRV